MSIVEYSLRGRDAGRAGKVVPNLNLRIRKPLG